MILGIVLLLIICLSWLLVYLLSAVALFIMIVMMMNVDNNCFNSIVRCFLILLFNMFLSQLLITLYAK